MTQIQDAFLDRTIPVPFAGCWIWTSAIGSEGYGIVKMLGETRHAHRVAYELFVGDIPDGLQLDHKCRVRCCVNPSHLEPVTSAENTRRGTSASAIHGRATACVNGHDFSPDNTRVVDGHRVCRTCERRRSRASQQRRRAAAAGLFFLPAPVASESHESGNGPEPLTVRS